LLPPSQQTLYYPTVSMDVAGAVIEANFGTKPFKYNLTDRLLELQAILVCRCPYLLESSN
jgi:hypothetical protein